MIDDKISRNQMIFDEAYFAAEAEFKALKDKFNVDSALKKMVDHASREFHEKVQRQDLLSHITAGKSVSVEVDGVETTISIDAILISIEPISNEQLERLDLDDEFASSVARRRGAAIAELVNKAIGTDGKPCAYLGEISVRADRYEDHILLTFRLLFGTSRVEPVESLSI